MNNNFGKKLKELRKSKGYTQQILAEKAGIDEKHLSRIENGKYFPSYLTLNKLLNALGTSVTQMGLELENSHVYNNSIIIKALQILNKAKNKEELDCYLEALKLVQKTLKVK